MTPPGFTCGHYGLILASAEPHYPPRVLPNEPLGQRFRERPRLRAALLGVSQEPARYARRRTPLVAGDHPASWRGAGGVPPTWRPEGGTHKGHFSGRARGKPAISPWGKGRDREEREGTTWNATAWEWQWAWFDVAQVCAVCGSFCAPGAARALLLWVVRGCGGGCRC